MRPAINHAAMTYNVTLSCMIGLVAFVLAGRDTCADQYLKFGHIGSDQFACRRVIEAYGDGNGPRFTEKSSMSCTLLSHAQLQKRTARSVCYLLLERETLQGCRVSKNGPS